MFLGIKEMKYSKGRYLLILSVIVLITWLVLILSGLADGLAQGNRRAIDSWNIDGLVLSEESNDNLNASLLNQKDQSKIKNAEVEPVGQMSVSIKKTQENKNTDRTNVALFGMDATSSILPKVISGKNFQHENEIIASETLKNDGFKLGDKLTIGTYDSPVTIVGWIPESSYNIVPVIYSSLDTWRNIKFGASKMDQVSGFTLKSNNWNQVKSDIPATEKIKTADFIEKLPGYAAQNMTLDGMIYFLLLIASFIIGIFIYVMTMQKSSMFGVLKVQGLSNRFLSSSVIGQTVALAVVGVIVGSLLTWLTTLVLPESMPFFADIKQMGLYSLLLILFAVVGSVFSVRKIVKINPLIAIGG